MSSKKLLILFFTLAVAVSAGAQSFTPTNCFAQGGICDASNSCVTASVNNAGLLIQTTIGTCASSPIIIGGGFDPPNPPPPGPYVAFNNNTRSMDRVVAARDTQRKLPGGTKKMQVMVFGAPEAVLTLSNKPGAGSAFFNSTRTTNTIRVRNNDTITIYGGTVSQKPRDLVITAALPNGVKIPGTIDLTVFYVDITGTVSGLIDQVLPMNAHANSGRPLVIRDNAGNKVRTLSPRSLRAYYKDLVTETNGGVVTVSDGKVDDRFQRGKADLDRVGHRHLAETIAYGGIVFKGTIVPAGIIQPDFSAKVDPNNNGKRESFNWIRNRDARDLLFDPLNNFVRATLCEARFDDSNDNDEDLLPDAKGNLWVFDTPAYIATPKNGRGALPDGLTARGYWIFGERLTYADEPVSDIQWWYWLYAHTNPIGDKNFVETPFAGLNVVGLGPMTTPDCQTGK